MQFTSKNSIFLKKTFVSIYNGMNFGSFFSLKRGRHVNNRKEIFQKQNLSIKVCMLYIYLTKKKSFSKRIDYGLERSTILTKISMN